MKISLKVVAVSLGSAFLFACSGNSGPNQGAPNFDTAVAVSPTNLSGVRWETSEVGADGIKSFTLLPRPRGEGESGAPLSFTGELGDGRPVGGSLVLRTNNDVGPVSADLSIQAGGQTQSGRVTLQLDGQCRALLITDDRNDRTTYTAQEANRRCASGGTGLPASQQPLTPTPNQGDQGLQRQPPVEQPIQQPEANQPQQEIPVNIPDDQG